MVVVVDDWILGSLERPTNRPKGADSTRRKDAGRLAGAGNCRDSGTGTVVKPTQDAKVQPLNATRNTNRPRYQQIRRGGLGYSCAVSAAFVIDGYDIDESALCCGWLFRLFLLGGFSVSGCFVSAPHFSHFSWHELPASTKLCIVSS